MPTFLIRLQRLIYRNRSFTFTSTGLRFVLLTLVVGVAAINTGNNLLYLIVGMMLSLIMISGILSEQSLRNVIVEQGFPNRIFAQQPVAARLRLTNGKKFLPSFSLQVAESDPAPLSMYVFKLPAGQATTLSYRTSFPRRGLTTRPPLVLRTTFPFGFFEKSHVRPQTQKVLVYPRILPWISGFETERSAAGQLYDRRQRGVGSALHSLRDYTSVDDARAIHWKASARKSKLILKEYEREENRQVLLFLSNRPPVESAGSIAPAPFVEDFERAIELAASLAVAFTRREYAVCLQTLSSNEMPSEETPQDLDTILKTLALLQPVEGSTTESLARRIAAMAGAAVGGRRILILPFPDPAWDSVRGLFTEVWIASEPPFKESEAQADPRQAGPRETGVRR